MIKQLDELTPADIEMHPIWVFPMDASVDDETSVRPVEPDEVVPDGLQILVRSEFRDRSGRKLPGYIYPDASGRVEDVRPVAWCDELCITFWNGIFEPAPDYLKEIRRTGLSWPLTYETVTERVGLQRGTLDGLYYLDGDEICCVRSD